jgi:cyclic pyranopterin phosphate synthase
MTTNGTLLSRFADELADAGLQRVNISLDTLRPERFAQITRLGKLEDALAGIEAAHRAGLRPVKINSVIIRGLNEDEILDLAQKTVTDGWNLRFIEWMPIGEADLAADWSRCVVTTKEIRDQVEAALGALTPAKPEQGGGPARYYRLPHATGTVGFVSPITAHFCHSCNRLRLTADGQLRPCLLSDQEIDLRTALRAGAGMQQIKDLLLQGIEQKPMQHHLDQAQSAASRTMAQIGG